VVGGRIAVVHCISTRFASAEKRDVCGAQAGASPLTRAKPRLLEKVQLPRYPTPKGERAPHCCCRQLGEKWGATPLSPWRAK